MSAFASPAFFLASSVLLLAPGAREKLGVSEIALGPVLTWLQLQKYEMVVQSLIEMGVDIVYPVELPSQSSLNLEDGKNSFEPIVCTSKFPHLSTFAHTDLYADSEFKECLAEFIRQFKITKVHSLAEIINFNKEHPELTLPPCTPAPVYLLPNPAQSC